MEEIIAEHLRVEQAHAFPGQGDAVDAGGIDRREIVDSNAAHAPEGQHRLLAVRPEHLGHDEIGFIGEIAPQQAGVRAFTLQIKFVVQRRFDLGHDVMWPDLVGRRMPALDKLAQCAQQFDIRADALGDAWPQNLDYDSWSERLQAVCFLLLRGGWPQDRRTSANSRAAYLRDRSRRSGVSSKDSYNAAIGAPSAARWRRAPACRETAAPDPAVARFVGDVTRRRVASRRKNLAELDEDRPSSIAPGGAARAWQVSSACGRGRNGRSQRSGRNRWACSTRSSSR